MLRTRLLNPGFFRNEDLLELPALTRLLFAGLWVIADREGRLEDRPRRIKIDVLPNDVCDVDKMLDALASVALIIRYSVEGQNFISVPSFNKYQHPHIDEKKSLIPPPPSGFTSAERNGHGAHIVEAIHGHEESTIAASSCTRTSTCTSIDLTEVQLCRDYPSSSKIDEEETEFALLPDQSTMSSIRPPKIHHERSEATKITDDPDTSEEAITLMFETWWRDICWRRVDKVKARRVFKKVLKSYGRDRNIYLNIAFDDLMRASIAYLERFKGTREWDEWRKNLHPSTFFRNARWEDERPIDAG